MNQDTRHTCEQCDGQYTHRNRKTHFKTKRHLQAIKQQPVFIQSPFVQIKKQCEGLSFTEKQELVLLIVSSMDAPVLKAAEKVEEVAEVVEEVALVMKAAEKVEEDTIVMKAAEIIEEVEELVEDVDEDAKHAEEYARYLVIRYQRGKTEEELEIYLEHHRFHGEPLTDIQKDSCRSMRLSC